MKGLFFLWIPVIFVISLISCSDDLSLNDHSLDKKELMEGKILVAISDYIQDDHLVEEGYQVYFEESGSKDLYNVDFQVENIQDYFNVAGKQVRVNSKLYEDKLFISSIEVLSNSKVTTRAPGNKNGGGPSGGSASILVAMVSDTSSVPNCTAADIEYQLIGSDNAESTKEFFSASSKGKFTIGNVTTTDVSITHITCSVSSLRSKVNPILQTQGFNLNQYDYIIYVTKNICSYGGQALLGGDVVHNAYCTWNVVNPHEIGHCRNMHHSTSYYADGSVHPYGDPSCVMATSFRELNAPHRIEQGWIKNNKIASINNSGSYFLSPIELDNPPEKQIYKVDVGMINFNRPENYYLSYRAPIGEFDDALSINVLNKLSIHTWSGESGRVTRYIGAIGEGESYLDSENGVIFENLGIQNEVMSFSVNFLTQ